MLQSQAAGSSVLTVVDVDFDQLTSLLNSYRLRLVLIDDGQPITGTFWGEPEAGVAGTTVYVRRDTPLHSLLHEACHIICMTPARRERLVKDAGGDELEEAAVCYLQILLADRVGGVGRYRLMRDMDSWGYSFRLGNTRAWFEQDAEDARQFLINQRLLGQNDEPVFKLRS